MDIDLENKVNEAIELLKQLSIGDIDFNEMDPVAKMLLVATLNEAQKIQDHVDSMSQRITERFRLTTVDAADMSNDFTERKFPKRSNPTMAQTERGDLSEPNSTRTDSSRQTISNSDKPSVREKLEGYKKEIELKKAIPVKEKGKAR